MKARVNTLNNEIKAFVGVTLVIGLSQSTFLQLLVQRQAVSQQLHIFGNEQRRVFSVIVVFSF